MIYVSKAPYRISLLGGSSDLDWFVNKYKRGLTLGFSIDAYSTIFIKRRKSFQKGLLNYSSHEEYSDIESITHPIIRSCLKRFSMREPLELFSIGDNLSGGGLGSSSAFTVALIKLISTMKDINLPNLEIANIASDIEINDLGNPIGRQDQYFSSLGGINILEFYKEKVIQKEVPLNLKKTIISYSRNLYLINTGLHRQAAIPLKKIKDDDTSYENIEKILKISDNFLNKSENKNVEEIEQILHDAIKNTWLIKKDMPGVMNQELLNLENMLNQNGLEVLKLLGAGSGGYFLVKSIDKSFEEISSLSEKFNFEINNFKIEDSGVKIIKI
tara:strand:+ start:184 stop:1170 length:987 start_codon:yes stop_codon:yes gene_type:complete